MPQCVKGNRRETSQLRKNEMGFCIGPPRLTG